VLTRAFPPDLVDEVIGATGTREVRRRLLPTRLVVYFVLALWLFRGRNCGYGQVMTKLADGLYHQRRAGDLLDERLDPDGWVAAGGGRRWKPPNISSLSRGRGKLGADPVRMLFEQVAGPTGADGARVAVVGEVETLYPEYRKKIKATYVPLEPCKRDCGAPPAR